MSEEKSREVNGTAPAKAARAAGLVLLILVAGFLAFALWPQEFRFERAAAAGPERVAVYTRWGCVVKEVILDEGGTPDRSRNFPLWKVPLWRIGSLPEVPGEWEERGAPAER